MQFLVYLAILMVSISTVLLEVHWLTSPGPQPKPTIQASAPPAPKTEGPNAALSPIYPKKPDAPRPAETGNSQAQNTPPVASVPPASQTAPAQQPEPAAPPGQTAPAEQTLPATPSPPSQQPATTPTTQAPPAALKSQAEAALSQAPAPQASAANAPSQQKSPAETTGVAAREENTRQAAADPTRPTNRVDDAQQTAQGSSSNRCDVQACASAYRSFRASDCTYQPFDGPRRFCGKPPGQQMAREQREQPERRRWSRDTDVRYLDRPTMGRRLDDDDDRDEFDDSDREPPGFFLFGRRPRL